MFTCCVCGCLYHLNLQCRTSGPSGQLFFVLQKHCRRCQQQQVNMTSAWSWGPLTAVQHMSFSTAPWSTLFCFVWGGSVRSTVSLSTMLSEHDPAGIWAPVFLLFIKWHWKWSKLYRSPLPLALKLGWVTRLGGIFKTIYLKHYNRHQCPCCSLNAPQWKNSFIIYNLSFCWLFFLKHLFFQPLFKTWRSSPVFTRAPWL